MSGKERYASYRYASKPDDVVHSLHDAPQSSRPYRIQREDEEYYDDPYQDRVHHAYPRSGPFYASSAPSLPPTASYREKNGRYLDDYRSSHVRESYRDVEPTRSADRGGSNARQNYSAEAARYNDEPQRRIHPNEPYPYQRDSRRREYDAYSSRDEPSGRHTLESPAYSRADYDAYPREVQPSYHRGEPSSPVRSSNPMVDEGLSLHQTSQRSLQPVANLPESPPRPSMSIFNMLNDRTANGAGSSAHSSPSKSDTIASDDIRPASLVSKTGQDVRPAASLINGEQPAATKVKQEEPVSTSTQPTTPIVSSGHANHARSTTSTKDSVLESTSLPAQNPVATKASSAKAGLKLRNNPLPSSKDTTSFAAPPPPAKKIRDADGWESDLDTDENRPLWEPELKEYVHDINDRMHLIETVFQDTQLQKQIEVERRMARAYESRHHAIIRRIRLLEQQEASQHKVRRIEDHARQQRDHEIEMELLDTLTDEQLAGAKGRARKNGQSADDVADLAQQEEDEESDEIALADIAARSRSNIIKLKRGKGSGINPRSRKRRRDDGASSPAPGSDADSALADYFEGDYTRFRDGDESQFASRQGSPSYDHASFAMDLDASGKVPIDVRRAQQLEDAHKRIWTTIAKRDVPKVYRTVLQSASSKTMYWRRLSSVVQREAKRGAARNNKTVKDVQLRARKVMREVLVFWKKNEKEERELRKKAEKEVIEKAKKEEEMREAKRQARKLNFLISQTELYSHFIGSKLKTAEMEESEETSGSNKIAPVVDVDPHSDLASAEAQLAELNDIDFDDEDESNLRAHAARNAQEAVRQAKEKAQAFDMAAAEERRKNEAAARELEGDDSGGRQIEEKDLGKAFDSDDMNFNNPTSMGQTEIKQPKMLTCQLKEYQLKGLNWLANLYEQGINGILADEMGLGKTVQSISLMAYLAEVHDIWGPFLVIAPASTLHNWQQEISKFVPTLKALPYWGNVKDRAVLRKFWNRKQISYNRDAPFHILVTSYQLVVSDEKYFQRVKWQYMILDEAQAIKSSSSIRWKTLLGFNCRNRLLLTGTPVQNSMQELWALLHFIMPSLFDSHDEFSEWFSKDIESHAEQKGTLNEHQLRRLHMILKPFMLRRIKKNVQNELGDKIEIDLFCDLSARQKMLYRGLRANMSVAELMDRATSNDEAGMKSLMNLVMQFRKVCNHPELFERADVRAPFAFAGFAQSGSLAREGDLLQLPDSTNSLIELEIPKLLVREGGVFDIPSDKTRKGFDTGYLNNLFNVWRSAHIHESLQQKDSAFGSLPLVGITPSDAEHAFHGDTIKQILKDAAQERRWRSLERFAADDDFAAACLRPIGKMLRPTPSSSGVSPSFLVPLEEVAADYRRHSYLVKDSARAVVTPAVAPPIRLYSNDGPFVQSQERLLRDAKMSAVLFGLSPEGRESPGRVETLQRELLDVPPSGIMSTSSIDQLPYNGMQVPQMNKLIVDSSKLAKLDTLLRELKAGGHRVLIYFQMTRMIDLMEEYLIYRQYKYLRLDGASKISDRRDMVTDWQTKPELFVFLLSTRAGGLGINLTAADTVVFYDHDWNPSNDSQAMDRAHRLGQTRQVTVYRLITKGTIDERIVRLARNKKEVQDIVVGNKAYTETGMAKPQEIVSLLLDDDELAESMLRKKQAEEAQLAQDKADSARAMHAKRRLNKDRAAAALHSPATTGVEWALEDDEDDFFGARPPSKADPDTADTTPQPQAAQPKKRAPPVKKARISEASDRLTPLQLDSDNVMPVDDEASSNVTAAPIKRKSKSHRKKTVEELSGLDLV